MELADVPGADGAEPQGLEDDPFEGRPGRPVARGEVPEADGIEQALPAAASGRGREQWGERPEADEADWLDQGIVEDPDDDGPVR
jgi:hypothetical protein